MANISLAFSNQLNISLQVGDLIYTSSVDQNTDEEWANTGYEQNGTTQLLGVVTNIESNNTLATSTHTIDVECVDGVDIPSNLTYVFFSKDNRVNTSSLKGYYGLASFRNNSIEKAELFSTAAEITESSK